MSLRPCTHCGRHVRNTESSCPFCATALEAAPARSPISLPRAGRAAIMAFGALTTAAAGCGGGSGTPDAYVGAQDAAYGGPPLDAFGGLDAAYGGPPVDAAMADDTGLPEADTGGGMNLYGGPPSDAGSDNTDAGGPVPLYGGAGL
jgi:hypothetical protein